MTMQLAPELIVVSKKIDRTAILAYAGITDDFNPIHVDPAFAATTPMKGIIAHGMLSLNLIWQSLRATCGAAAAQGATLEVRFVRPVRENDVVSAGGLLSDDGRAYDVALSNQGGETVISGRLTLARPATETVHA